MAAPLPTPESSEEFVRELTDHQTAMLAYIRSLAPGSPNARDLLQEVNITLWKKRDSFQLGTNFKAWSFQTIRYHILNHRRKLTSQGWLIFDDDIVEMVGCEWETGPNELEDRHLALRRCLQKLRPQDRDILHHRYATDGSLKQYAAATNRAPGTLKAILFNLRGALRKCIEGQLREATHPAR